MAQNFEILLLQESSILHPLNNHKTYGIQQARSRDRITRFI